MVKPICHGHGDGELRFTSAQVSPFKEATQLEDADDRKKRGHRPSPDDFGNGPVVYVNGPTKRSMERNVRNGRRNSHHHEDHAVCYRPYPDVPRLLVEDSVEDGKYEHHSGKAVEGTEHDDREQNALENVQKNSRCPVSTYSDGLEFAPVVVEPPARRI